MLSFVRSLGVVVNLKKSDLSSSQGQVAKHLGMEIHTRIGKVFPSEERKTKLLRLISQFLDHRSLPAKKWRVLLGILSSEKLVPRGRIRTRALQWQLKNHWSPSWSSALQVPLNTQIWKDLQWWAQEGNLMQGLPLGVASPQTLLFTDASTEG